MLVAVTALMFIAIQAKPPSYLINNFVYALDQENAALDRAKRITTLELSEPYRKILLEAAQKYRPDLVDRIKSSNIYPAHLTLFRKGGRFNVPLRPGLISTALLHRLAEAEQSPEGLKIPVVPGIGAPGILYTGAAIRRAGFTADQAKQALLPLLAMNPPLKDQKDDIYIGPSNDQSGQCTMASEAPGQDIGPTSWSLTFPCQETTPFSILKEWQEFVAPGHWWGGNLLPKGYGQSPYSVERAALHDAVTKMLRDDEPQEDIFSFKAPHSALILLGPWIITGMMALLLGLSRAALEQRGRAELKEEMVYWTSQFRFPGILIMLVTIIVVPTAAVTWTIWTTALPSWMPTTGPMARDTVSCYAIAMGTANFILGLLTFCSNRMLSVERVAANDVPGILRFKN